MITETLTYYEILEVDYEATEEEIKRAYHRKIRMYTNEKHPEEFKLIRKAYEILSNANERIAYDQMFHPESIYDNVLDHILQLIEQSEYEDALDLVKQEMVNGDPSMDLLRADIVCEYMLGNIAYVLRQLKSMQPMTEDDYMFRYYYTIYSHQQIEQNNEAEKAGKQFISHFPEKSEPYELLVRIYKKQKKYKEIKTLINKLMRNKKVEKTIDFIPTFIDFLMLPGNMVNMYITDFNRVRKTILSIPKNEEEREKELNMILHFVDNIQPGDSLDGVEYLVAIADKLNDKKDHDLNARIVELKKYVAREKSGADSDSANSWLDKSSIIVTLIVGLLLTLLTAAPLLGIIVAILYYRRGKKFRAFIGYSIVALSLLKTFGII
ncbi:J domain-containing protein [Bacillus sp. FSL K6-3431]|uniref:J domain-containing protein n=1 Tax=Bacillus sp. FSL K6-3431 TaxID=2921500 RepID=UPI0030F525BC